LMKLLFLDVDGVLNDGYRGYPFLVEPCLRLLKHIIEETKAQVVLSSNWRLFNEYRGVLLPKLIEHGIIKTDVFSSTPDLDLDHLPLRPREILQWIRDSTSICPWQKNRELPRVSQFVVIDDRNLVKELYGHTLQSHFVQTNGQIGLTLEIAKKVIKLLNQRIELASTSIWALNHWQVFHEFESVSYVQCPMGFRVVDHRVCQDKVYTPLDYFPSDMLHRILQFLSTPEIAALSVTSHKFSTISASNDLWQPRYNVYQNQSQQRLRSNDLLFGNVFHHSWPTTAPIQEYYKMACCLFLASTSSPSPLKFAQKFLQSTSSDSRTMCSRCHENSELVSATVALSKYGLTVSELSCLGFTTVPSHGTLRRKARKRYCDIELQLAAVLKWGSFGGIRKRRASWQTSVEEICADGSRKAVKLLQSLRLKNSST